MGRAPFDSKFRAALRAPVGSFAPIGRGSAPAYRHLVRSRVAALRGNPAVDHEDVRSLGFERVSPILESGASATEFGDLLRPYVDGIPLSAAWEIAARSGLVGHASTLEPLGVIAGMVFAVVARAS